MKLASGKQMAEIDKRTIEEYSFPSILLMENAGFALTQAMINDFPALGIEPVVILIGPGNNGGDAFVTARQLYKKDIPSMCVFLGNPDKMKGSLKKNHELHKSLELNKNAPLMYIDTEEKWEEYKFVFLSAGFIIDGIFGTGIQDRVKGFYENVITDINKEFKGKVLSIDVPSGLICHSGKQNPVIISADKTYTIGLPKLGMLDYPGKTRCGDIEVLKIGFPESLLNSNEIKTNVLNGSIAKSLKPCRTNDSNKGDFGHVLVVAGSGIYPGAAHLSALGAKKAGAGLVTLASMFTVCNGLKNKDNEIIIKPFEDVIPETDMNQFQKELLNSDKDSRSIQDILGSVEMNSSLNGEFISKENIQEIRQSFSEYSCAVLGPGMGQNNETASFILSFLEEFDSPVVVDADALNVIAKDLGVLKGFKNPGKLVFTPHAGEFSRLTGRSIEDIKNNKPELAMEFSQKQGVILILKDSVTTVTNGENIYYNTTGNSGLARGGSGDVLAGMIGAFIARGLDIFNAGLFSVYLHGLTADIIAREKGVEGVFPTGIINNLYKGFLEI